jgi:hypothetical protein
MDRRCTVKVTRTFRGKLCYCRLARREEKWRGSGADEPAAPLPHSWVYGVV